MQPAVPVIEPPASAMLMRLESPPLPTVAPELVHPGLRPASVVAATAAFDVRRFDPAPVLVWMLRDVIVAAQGLVFTGDGGAVYAPSITQHAAVEIGHAAAEIRQALATGTMRRSVVPLVLGKKRGADNHGHWLIEMLPMLHLVLSRLSDDRIGVLVHDTQDPRLGAVMQTSLRRLGIADARVAVTSAWPVRVGTLILVQGLTNHGVYMSPLVRECHERLAHGVEGLGHQRVFVARGAGYRRNFADDAGADRMAADAGYHVLDAGSTGLLEQIAAMRDARTVAGALGAGMTAIAYARAPAQAVLFAGAAMPDTFFWFLANVFGHGYRQICCGQAAGPYPGSYDGDLQIDPHEFRQALAHA